MSGLGSRQSSNVTFLSIIQGKISKKAHEMEPGAVSRENKKGVLVWEIHNDWVCGYLKEVLIREDEYIGGKFLSFVLEVNEHDYKLDVSTSTRYATNLATKIGSLALGEQYTFVPYDFEDESGKKRTGVNIYVGQPDAYGAHNKDNKILPSQEIMDSQPKYPADAAQNPRAKDKWKLEMQWWIDDTIASCVALIMQGQVAKPAPAPQPAERPAPRPVPAPQRSQPSPQPPPVGKQVTVEPSFDDMPF